MHPGAIRGWAKACLEDLVSCAYTNGLDNYPELREMSDEELAQDLNRFDASLEAFEHEDILAAVKSVRESRKPAVKPTADK